MVLFSVNPIDIRFNGIIPCQFPSGVIIAFVKPNAFLNLLLFFFYIYSIFFLILHSPNLPSFCHSTSFDFCFCIPNNSLPFLFFINSNLPSYHIIIKTSIKHSLKYSFFDFLYMISNHYYMSCEYMVLLNLQLSDFCLL